MADFAQFFSGNPARVEQLNRYRPGQENILNQLAQSGLQRLQNPYQGFQPIQQQATNFFNQQVVPSLAERFTSMGGMGGSNAISSPAFASQLGQAGAGLSENLAALQSQYGMQNQSQALQQLQLGLQPQFENVPVAGQAGAGEGLLQLLMQIAPGLIFGAATGGLSSGAELWAPFLKDIAMGAAKGGISALSGAKQ